MRENGTDRDVALMMLSNLQTINAKLEDINNHLYAVYIFQQPTNQEVALNGTCTFTVNATNVKAYQWQYLPTGVTEWRDDTTTLGSDTDTLAFTVGSAGFYQRSYRCKMTGNDNNVVYSNVVIIINPDS